MTLTHAIYAGREHRRPGPPRPALVPLPQPEGLPEPEALPEPEREPALPPLDAALIAVLDSGPVPGETIEVAFRRKECELAELFASLAADDALALHRRLASPRDGDPVATRFARLVVARRERLLGFLADARRRAAVAAVKGVRRG